VNKLLDNHQSNPNDECEGLCLGLIGGLGVGATIHYYQALVKAHAARGRTANLLILHADVNRILHYAARGETRQMAEYLSPLIQRRSAGGARFAGIPATTPHICASELIKLSPIPLVSLVEEIVREVHLRMLKRVALFGTRFTIETELFGQLKEVDVVLPGIEEVELIHSTYLQIVNAGYGGQEQYEVLRRIAHTLCERDGVEAVILAGTELSLVFNDANTDFACIDGARLQLDAIMRHLVPEQVLQEDVDDFTKSN
jgi:aspartate racemase